MWTLPPGPLKDSKDFNQMYNYTIIRIFLLNKPQKYLMNRNLWSGLLQFDLRIEVHRWQS